MALLEAAIVATIGLGDCGFNVCERESLLKLSLSVITSRAPMVFLARYQQTDVHVSTMTDEIQ